MTAPLPNLMYAGRTRNRFKPSSREKMLKWFKCPFANLPEAKAGRWGIGLTVEKMKDCRWLKPFLVGQFEFVEWTQGGHLRHSRFIGQRDDKEPHDVGREVWRCVRCEVRNPRKHPAL